LKEERRGQSAIARLVTPKPYQFERLCDRIKQQEWDRKRTDSALMKDTLDTSSPQTEDKVKNQHVQAVEEWIAATVKETLFEYFKSKALEKTVEKHIKEEMTRSNLEMKLEVPLSNANNTLWRTESFLACLGALLNLKRPDLFDDHKMISRRAPHFLPW
jgi:hypothetical protein